MITPPIVGVPFFNYMINWTILSYRSSNHLIRKIFINGPPMIKTTIKEVITDKPVLKVKYLNTLKKLLIDKRS